MSLVIILQVVFIFAMFVLTFCCVLLPLKIIPRDRSQWRDHKSQRIIELCNCFAGGVFLGTCFLQLIPFTQSKFHLVFEMAGRGMQYAAIVTQLSVMIGFFLILFIEHGVKMWQQARQPKQPDHMHEMTSLPKEFTIPDIGSAESDTGSEEDEEEEYSEMQQMLKKRSTDTPNGNAFLQNATDVTGSTPHGGSTSRDTSQSQNSTEEHHHSTGHGHSHITDIVKDDFGLRCLFLLFALSIHSLFEGLALGLQSDIEKTVTLFIGIAVHEVLVAFAIGVSLAQQSLKVATIVKLCLIFSLTIPVGIAIGMAVNGFHTLPGQAVSATIQGLTAGTFVYVTFLEILPAEINSHSEKMLKVFFIFLGFSVLAGLAFGMGTEH